MKAKQEEGEDGDESIFEVQALLDPRESTIQDLNGSTRDTSMMRESMLPSG